MEDFKIIYEKKQKQRDKILKEIKIIQESLNQNDEQIMDIFWSWVTRRPYGEMKLEKNQRQTC